MSSPGRANVSRSWKPAFSNARTEVRFELEEDGAGTVVHLSHTGFREGDTRDRHDHGWAHYAERLKRVAEGGDPGPDVMADATA